MAPMWRLVGELEPICLIFCHTQGGAEVLCSLGYVRRLRKCEMAVGHCGPCEGRLLLTAAQLRRPERIVPDTRTAVVVVAAGRGTRAGAGDLPKQYRPLAGTPVLAHSLAAFAGHGGLGPLQVVIHPDDHSLYAAVARDCAAMLLPPVAGGATRQASVRAGLLALRSSGPDQVLIHDASRPLVSRAVIDRVLAALPRHPAVSAALPVGDTLKRTGENGVVAATVERRGLWRAQTPQAFRYGSFLAAHERAWQSGRSDFTDDAALADWAGLEVALVAGSERNLKITTAEDLALAETLVAGERRALTVRTGSGFDVHRTTAGDHVWLCGVRIPHSAGLEGHSDADVGLHALTDALLGAIADGDIGEHFPPSDPRWKNAPSHVFLRDAARRVGAAGGVVSNVDVTILCEAPRIAPHRIDMRAAIAAALGIGVERVNVKATTAEGLGFIGRGEGIAAMANATVLLPLPKKEPS
jgi:2-C-methyl-D-erythritol 4-phosphate cytidylyltransferase/2-C-methyl-D-erythritol 2,4-cyclodiphosphate synthase